MMCRHSVARYVAWVICRHVIRCWVMHGPAITVSEVEWCMDCYKVLSDVWTCYQMLSDVWIVVRCLVMHGHVIGCWVFCWHEVLSDAWVCYPVLNDVQACYHMLNDTWMPFMSSDIKCYTYDDMSCHHSHRCWETKGYVISLGIRWCMDMLCRHALSHQLMNVHSVSWLQVQKLRSSLPEC